MFCCPLKFFAEHCMVGDGEAAKPIWQSYNMSFCEWIGSKVRSKCSRPEQEDTNCCSGVCSCCLDIENKKFLNCKCLECNCTALCSNFNDWTCMKCAKDNDSSLNVCENCNCLTDSESGPLSCPTYKMKVSSNLRDIVRCPGCPERVLCFTCSEDQCVICCCHYMFCNRCGDPGFTYNDKINTCSFRDNSCCSALFTVLLSLPRFLFLGCFGLCENSIRCCYFTCVNCTYLVCCKCTDEKFCMNYTCLCFECEKLGNIQETSFDNDIETCKCACCIYMPEKSAPFLNAEIEISKPEDLLQTEGKVEVDLTTEARSLVTVHERQQKIEIVDENNVSSSEALDEMDYTRKKTKKKVLTKRKHVSKARTGEAHNEGIDLYIESDTSDEGESYLEVKHMRRLQGELLKNDLNDTDSEEVDFGNTLSMNSKPSRQSDVQFEVYGDRRKIDGNVNTHKNVKTGILKIHSSHSVDSKNSKPFSVYNESRSCDQSRCKKRAHFANEDEDLIKELFPKQFSVRCEDGSAVTDRKRKVRRKQICEKTVSETPKKIYKRSHEREIITNVNKHRDRETPCSDNRNLKLSVKSFCDNEETSKTFDKRKTNVLAYQHFNETGINRSRKRNEMNRRQKSIQSENSERIVEVKLIDYNSSEEEFAVERRNREEELKLEDLDSVSNEPDQVSKMDKNRKSINQRLKEMKHRLSQAE